MSWGTEDGEKSLHISQDVLRSVLYGKWCSVFGDDREMTFKSDAMFRKDVYKSENMPRDTFGHVSRLSPTTVVPLLDAQELEASSRSRAKYRETREATRYMTFVSLPEQVCIGSSSIPGIKLGVFTNCWIKEGTHMGPFTGQILKKDEINYNVDNNLMWEVLSEDGEVSHFIDGKDESPRNWMCFVNCARNEQEQNLEIFQYANNIYYRATKDIPPEQELLVWYGANYVQFLGIPGIPPIIERPRRRRHYEAQVEESVIVAERNTQSQAKQELLPQEQNGRLKCTICRRGFNSRSNLRSHMRIHTLEKPFQCKYCKKCFSQSSTLRNHTRLHTGEKPYKCTVCHFAYSQLAGLRAHQKSARHKPDFLKKNSVLLSDGK